MYLDNLLTYAMYIMCVNASFKYHSHGNCVKLDNGSDFSPFFYNIIIHNGLICSSKLDVYDVI